MRKFLSILTMTGLLGLATISPVNGKEYEVLDMETLELVKLSFEQVPITNYWVTSPLKQNFAAKEFHPPASIQDIAENMARVECINIISNVSDVERKQEMDFWTKIYSERYPELNLSDPDNTILFNNLFIANLKKCVSNLEIFAK